MAAKGSIAKTEVAKKIAQAFGADWIGEVDKKYYVWAEENGERMQIAISMTCPKVPVASVDTAKLDFGNSKAEINFEEDDKIAVAHSTFAPAEISEEELQNVAELMARLGL